MLPTNIAMAQSRDVQWYLEAISGFINGSLIPFFFALAILFLLINVTRYFIIEGADVSAHEQARKYIMYAIIALVFLSSIWGVINIIIRSFGVDGNIPICPDYNLDCDTDSDYDDGGGYDYNDSNIENTIFRGTGPSQGNDPLSI